LADAHNFEIMTYDAANRAEQLDIAETAISKALTIAPERALAHYVHAGVLLARQAPERALRACELALGFDRDLAVAHAYIGQIKILWGGPRRRRRTTRCD
jgi:tetratricopeptide (TPR) repeat protein